MIKGIGTDIVAIARISRMYTKFSQRSLARILSPLEREHVAKMTCPVAFLAKRFALKEAVVKAL
ncbi:MAG: 4'-phosphopantetheinyl transferase superfamily protein, partial [Pseudomonadota bacterium]